MSKYEPRVIEPKWQAFWEREHTFATRDDATRPKSYILDMFPYPSGAGLHVGHPEGYTATDILARYRRSRGHAVLHPMGWDAFGLPAEQYAIETGTHPRITTAQNVKRFREQIKMLGLSYDWSREIDTTDPGYFRWTQWIFLRLFARGLAYQAETPVNWCAALGTVLANEEVKDGVSERGGHSVERVPLRQWMLKITAYADRLLSGFGDVQWPESTVQMQREWIGRSEGAEVKFPLAGATHDALEVFTTRPDTLFGVTYLAIAPEHPWLDRLAVGNERGRALKYADEARRRSDLERRAGREKTGAFTGSYVVHPLSGEKIPVWVADYVLWGYGTGAVMAVPAHDQRDYEFAKAHALPIKVVVAPPNQTFDSATLVHKEAFEGEGISVASGDFSGLPTAIAKRRITEALAEKELGHARVEYKLRDWVFSRQRYWGEPIPIYFPVETTGDPRQQKAGEYTIRYDQPIAVDEQDLPILPPELDDFRPGNDPAGPLARAVDWRFFQKDGRWYARETNTMPQWAGSCWYYLRFIDPHNDREPFSQSAAKRWLPVDLYVGGAEHAVLHLLYARFWHKVLFDEGLVPTDEPFTKLVHQGMILGEVEYIYEGGDGTSVRVTEEQTELRDGKRYLKNLPDVIVTAKAHKMSKSRGNVVNPDDVVREFGADSMRLFEMFLGPLEATKPWNTNGLHGMRRFLERCQLIVTERPLSGNLTGELERTLHKAIKKVTEDIEALRFNTAISTMMVLSSELAKLDAVPRVAAETLTLLLHPFAPHLAEELWEQLGHRPSIQSAEWPTFDSALCEDENVEVAVQVNGKVRGRVRLSKDAPQSDALAAAKADPAVARHLEGKTLVKELYVPARIITLVVK